jgi:hypothetical protein
MGAAIDKMVLKYNQLSDRYAEAQYLLNVMDGKPEKKIPDIPRLGTYFTNVSQPAAPAPEQPEPEPKPEPEKPETSEVKDGK